MQGQRHPVFGCVASWVVVEFGDVGVEGSGVVGGLSHSSFSLFIAVGLSYSSLSFGIFKVSDGSTPPCPYPLPSAKMELWPGLRNSEAASLTFFKNASKFADVCPSPSTGTGQ